MARWMFATAIGFLAIVVVIVLVTGHPTYVWPVLALGALIAAYAAVNVGMARAIADEGDVATPVVTDAGEPLPASHLVPDDDSEIAVGDTPEAHDEITAHDLPKGHPGRGAAERQSARSGVTRGHDEGGAQPVVDSEGYEAGG